MTKEELLEWFSTGNFEGLYDMRAFELLLAHGISTPDEIWRSAAGIYTDVCFIHNPIHAWLTPRGMVYGTSFAGHENLLNLHMGLETTDVELAGWARVGDSRILICGDLTRAQQDQIARRWPDRRIRNMWDGDPLARRVPLKTPFDVSPLGGEAANNRAPQGDTSPRKQ